MLTILLYTFTISLAVSLLIFHFFGFDAIWDDEDEEKDIRLSWGCPRIVKSVLQEYPDEKKPHVGHLPGPYEPALLEPHEDVGDKQG